MKVLIRRASAPSQSENHLHLHKGRYQILRTRFTKNRTGPHTASGSPRALAVTLSHHRHSVNNQCLGNPTWIERTRSFSPSG